MTFKPEPVPCPVCKEIDCRNEMCSSHPPYVMIGDEEIPQLGTEEAGRFFVDD